MTASEYEFSDSIVIDASPEAVYELITDVGRTGEWSPVCTGCEWEDGDGPRVGARFTGHNAKDGREWSTTSEIVAATPGAEFAWEVNGGLVYWQYLLEPTDGGTRVTESWEFREAGRDFFREHFGDQAQAAMQARIDDARTGIPETLATIKRLVESA